MKKIIALSVLAVVFLTGCAISADSKKLENGDFEGYKSELVYEVKTEDGAVKEQMFELYDENDQEKTSPAGRKDITYDPETGKLSGYTVTLGLDDIKELVTYKEDASGGEFYNEIYFDSGHISRETWDNRYLDSETGEEIRETGEHTYYPSSDDLKTLREEIYRAGELVSEKSEEY